MFKAWLNFRKTYVSYKSNNYINKFFHILYERLFHIHVVHLLVMYFKKNHFSNNFEADKKHCIC